MEALLAKCKEIWSTVWKVWGRQKLEAPEFFDGMITTALRLCLLALLGLAVVLLVTLILSEIKRRREPDEERRKSLLRRVISLGGAFAVVLGLCAWAYWPAPLAQTDQEQSVTLSSRVPGKKEKPVELTESQTDKLLELLQNTSCVPSWQTDLPYAGYGQMFRITLLTDAGEVRILAAPETGCLYTETETGLIYTIVGYGNFYKALGTL